MDYYQTLGIVKGADEKTIRKAYRKQALKFHPDKNPDPRAADQFRLISEALNALLLQAAGTDDSTSRAESQWAQELQKAEKFREKLFKSTKPETNTQGISHKRLRELSLINTKLRRRRMERPKVSCRTLKDGRVFDTVEEARAYVDSHPEAELVDSWFENEYSRRYEYETLRRVGISK